MFGIKLAPKGIKLCPGCPPKNIEPVHVPKFRLGAPQRKKDTKVVQIVDMSQYKKDKKNNNGNALF